MELLDSFHFARPWALLLIPVTLVQVIWYLRFRHTSNPWQNRMRADLQQQLLAAPEQTPVYQVWILLAILLAGTALAGPSWSQQSRPVLSRQDNLVVVMDLSLSMLAQDLQPNRLTRGKQKLQDLLQQRREGMTALVVYSGHAHTVTPLTRDTATISNLLPALDPLMMPELGSAAESGIARARELIQQSGFSKGRILLITDGLDDTAQNNIGRLLKDGIQLSILLLGTASGAPIPLDDQGFVKDQQGNVIISQVDLPQMQRFAGQHQIRLHRMTLDNSDLDSLLPPPDNSASLRQEAAALPLWIEQGHWFLLPVLPLAALAFRRNWLLLLPLMMLLPQPALAFWQDLQSRGESAFEQGDYATAEQLLEDPLWRGSAYYRQGDYEAAIQEYAKQNSAQAHYNRGNALARLGRFDEAISAYSRALEQNPDLQDAAHNRQLVEQLKAQQQQQQQQQPEQDAPSGSEEASPSSEEASPSSEQPNQNPNNSSNTDPGGSEQPSGEGAAGENRQESSQTANAQQNLDSEGNRGNMPEANGAQASADDARGNNPLSRPDQAEQNTPAPDGSVTDTEGMSEETLSLEQWLRRIPDDPAGLLRRKFEYEARKNREPLPEGREPW